MENHRRLLVGLSGNESDFRLIRYTAMLARLHGQSPRVSGGAETRADEQRRPAGQGERNVLLRRRPARKPRDHASPRAEPGMEIRFVQVMPRPRPEGGPSDYLMIRRQLREEIVANFGDVPESVPVLAEVLKGTPMDRLLDYASEHESQLLIAGLPTSPSARRSLAVRLAMHAPCSVCLVPPESPPVLRRILVPVDFSERSAEGLRVALSVARRQPRAKCTVLHVYFDHANLLNDDHVPALRRRKQAEYEQFVEPLQTRGVVIEPEFAEGANVAHVIARTADRCAVDLIVLTTRRRTRVAAMALGGITEDTILRAPAPLLIVRQSGAALGLLRALWEKAAANDNVRFS